MDGTVGAARDFAEAFMSFEYAGQTLIALGLLLMAYGAYRVVKSSLVLVIWVLLGGLGLGLLNIGMEHMGIDHSTLRGHGGAWLERLGSGALSGAETLERTYRQLRSE